MDVMRAITYAEYGKPELSEVPRPEPAAGEVLVRVRACALNPLNSYFLFGHPYAMRVMTGLSKPKVHRVGTDVSGTIETVGSGESIFQSGDEVFGVAKGALAEYVTALPMHIVKKPPRASFEDAAALPVAGVTALQSLRDGAKVQPGQKVLINGAAGGVGSFAVQIAKHLGARVTAVCSTDHVEMVRSLGADRVVDYTREDFTRIGETQDILLDVVGGRRWRDYARVLTPRGLCVVVGGPRSGRWLGPMAHIARVRVDSLFARQKLTLFAARVTREDLQELGRLLESGAIRSVVGRRFRMEEVSQAFAYLNTGHATGKIVVTVSP